MKTVLPGAIGAAFMAIGHFGLGYSWQECAISGLALVAILIANQNQEMKAEIDFLRARVSILEDKLDI